jgi:hypothetical protein
MKGLILLAALASYQPPKGYDVTAEERGSDAVVTMTKGSHKLRILLFAEGSAGLEPYRSGSRRPYPLAQGDAGLGGSSEERYRLFKAEGGTFVLSTVWESPTPDLKGVEEKGWKALQAGFKLKKGPSAPRRKPAR